MAFKASREREQVTKKQVRFGKTEIKHLKKDLRVKDKALTEIAALLELRKKLNALWGEEDKDS